MSKNFIKKLFDKQAGGICDLNDVSEIFKLKRRDEIIITKEPTAFGSNIGYKEVKEKIEYLLKAKEEIIKTKRGWKIGDFYFLKGIIHTGYLESNFTISASWKDEELPINKQEIEKIISFLWEKYKEQIQTEFKQIGVI